MDRRTDVSPLPFRLVTLVDGAGWSAGLKPYEQGPIHTMPSAEILHMDPPPGVFYFFYPIDDNMDGVPAGQ